MVEKKEWSEFRETGLLLFINQFLHIFGWAIVLQIEDDKIIDVYPARVSFKGFPSKSTTKAYKQLDKFMKNEHK
jgi:hypothetical protein